MAQVVILGAGVMGAAMAVPLDANGHDTVLLGTHLDQEIVRSVAGNGYHPNLKITLPGSVTAGEWPELGERLAQDPALILLGVSSLGVEWAIDRLAETLTKPVPILMITKGLATPGGSIEVLPTYVAQALRARTGFSVPVSAIAGPAIAGEQAAGRETSVVLTGTDREAAAAARALLAHGGYRMTLSEDVIGVELCAALKNFYALGVGAGVGWHETAAPTQNDAQMNNALAALFTQALAEMTRIVTHLGGKTETVMGLAGVGDLWVTCRAGRNSRMGRLLGLGLRFSEAKAQHMAADTVEGADLAKAICAPLRALLTESGMAPQMPLTNAILDAVHDDTAFPRSLEALHAAIQETAL